jgi:crossover junction endodeoxyribonuclease RusA
MIDIELWLPFPPSTNNYYVKTRNGVFISAKGKKYRAQAAESLSEQLGVFQPIEEPILIECIWYPPCARKRDQDNFVGKAFFDAMTHGGLWLDDSQIVQSFVYKGEIDKSKSGMIYLRLSDGGPILPLGHRF